MSTPKSPIPSPGVPVIDPKTGLMNREWYRFLSGPTFNQLAQFLKGINVTGGTTTDTLTASGLITALSSVAFGNNNLIKGGNLAVGDVTVQPGTGNWLYVQDFSGALAPVKCGAPTLDDGHAITRGSTAASLGGTGWVKFPVSGGVGWMIQWGQYTGGASGVVNVSITNFPSGIYQVFATVADNTSTQFYVADATILDNSTIQLHRRYGDVTTASGGQATQNCAWVVLGRWQ